MASVAHPVQLVLLQHLGVLELLALRVLRVSLVLPEQMAPLARQVVRELKVLLALPGSRVKMVPLGRAEPPSSALERLPLSILA